MIGRRPTPSGAPPGGAVLTLVVVSGVVILPCLGQAQDSIPPTRLAPVEVTVTRDAARSALELPYAVTVTHPDRARPEQRRAGLDELLVAIPGVTVANRNNPAQDPRIAIRGFGTRSAFGVRGVRVLRDGVPLTLPDGQTPVDAVDVESISAVQVIRGAASSLYGNAGGGVIDFQSPTPPPVPFSLSGRLVLGELGLRDHDAVGRRSLTGNVREVIGAAGAVRDASYQATVTHTESDGWRDYSRQRSTNAYGRGAYVLRGMHLGLQTIWYDAPEAQNPGALTQTQFDSDPRQADPFSVRKQTGKRVVHRQLALTAQRLIGAGHFSTALYTGTRALDNPLPFAVVEVDRRVYGAAVQGSAMFPVLGFSQWLTVGADAQWQDDDRRNYANCADTLLQTLPTARCPRPFAQRGVLQLAQRERISSFGPFVRSEFRFRDRYQIVLGARSDEVRFRLDDHLTTPANPVGNSGERTLHAVSPMGGLVVRLGLLHAFYANVSTAFETPTTTELGNTPDGRPGINADLQPQSSTTDEVGIRGYVAGVRYDAAAFRTGVRDELVPYQVPGGSGRSYFRNAGTTDRRGAELGLSASVGAIEVVAAYGYSNFRFVDYTVVAMPGSTATPTSFAGNRIPGAPVHQFQGSTTWRSGPAFVTVELLGQTRIDANDANTVAARGYEVVNLRAGLPSVARDFRLTPVVGIQNVFDRRYAGAVALNATQGKYFEPAPGRSLYVALSLLAGQHGH
ncbi:MAG: TonB-dependent receptor [Gemmatimonadaceae bacterium]